ncbi:hypothetical protein NC652_034171 [Populus alba x Populus x berolinensis]|nr:hypothetical protein NC652_034171 [Populus alba x Populus x berolinensis]
MDKRSLMNLMWFQRAQMNTEDSQSDPQVLLKISLVVAIFHGGLSDANEVLIFQLGLKGANLKDRMAELHLLTKYLGHKFNPGRERDAAHLPDHWVWDGDESLLMSVQEKACGIPASQVTRKDDVSSSNSENARHSWTLLVGCDGCLIKSLSLPHDA